MEELLNKVAEMRGMPASLVKRSAEARAEKTGSTLEAVLRDWAGEDGGEEVAVPPTDDPVPASETPQPAAKTPPPATASDSVPSEITVDYLIQLAADAKRMPPKLILSSAEARAKHSGASLETVLAGWAGVDLADLKAQALDAPEGVADAPAEAAAEPEPEPVTEPAKEAPAAAPPATAAVAGAVIGMDELLEKVAEAKGMPAVLAKRSAEARAKKTGEPLEAVLADWAGVDPSTVAVGTAEASVPAPDEPAADVPADPEPEQPDEIEVIEATAPETAPAAEAQDARSFSRYPAWLAAAFVIIPLLAVMYIMVSPNGPDCGTSGQLLIDPVTGEAVNCDGSAYGSQVVDYFGNGAAVYAQCQACHGAGGEGGAGPAFSGGELLMTFPEGSCTDQIEWVALGTAGWPDPTYGATNKPVGGVGLMPAFATTLSPEQIAEVTLYERVQFGGQDLAAAEADCGFGDDHSDDETAVEASGS